MWRTSGIILLVFFCCISGISQSLLPGKAEDNSSERKLNRLLNIAEEPKAGEITALPEKEFMEAARELNFKPGMAEAMVNLGRYYLDGGDSENALKYFRYYEKICLEMQDSVLLADAYGHLGRLYNRQNFSSMAEEKFTAALEIALQLNNHALRGKCYNQLGGFYYSQQKYFPAEGNFLKSLKYFSSEKDKVSYAASLHNLGMVMKARKEYRRSLEYFKEAYSLLQDHKNVGDLGAVLLNTGEIYQIFNDYSLAEIYYLKALNAAQEAGAVDRITDSYQYLARLYAEKEQYQEAYTFQSLYSAYKDTLVHLTHRASEAEVNKKLELERRERVMNQLIKEKELELLNREYKISRLELSRKNVLIYITGSISLLLSMLAFIFYQRYIIKKKKNFRLELQHLHTSRHNEELQELNSRLQQSELRLKELNDTQNKFFSIISHDLRGPLNTLSGFIQVMKKDTGLFNKEELNLFSLRMERSLHGVASLLDNLFQWASAQTGLIEFSPGDFRIEKLLKENVFLLQDTADLKKISLSYEVETGLMVTADIQMMRLLLRNMVSNAVKFTTKGGFVHIKAMEEDSWTLIKITDNGIGISAENRQKLLQDKPAHTRPGTDNEKGSGLGLILCKEFVEMHRGRIEVESAPGAGTTFLVYLPLKTTKLNAREEANV